MADIFKTVRDAAGLIRGKEKGVARSKWDKGSNKSTRPGTSTKKSTKPRLSPRAQVAKNRAAAEADAKAQGFTRTSRGTYVKTEVADSVKNMKPAPAKPSITKAMGVLGVTPKKTSTKKNVKNAKRRVKKGKK